jgi:ABC-type dipeptide/oligopeptide/nickel transport system permease subunit
MMRSTMSPGLWTLAWRRLRADRVAMVSLAVVCLFLLSVVLSGDRPCRRRLGRRGGRELRAAGVHGARSRAGRARAAAAAGAAERVRSAGGRHRGPDSATGAAGPRRARGQTDDAAFRRRQMGPRRRQKTIKGGQTSIVVGLVAAFVAVLLGTLFGALSGFYGGRVDDLFNWFYSVFTSIPSILMILTVAAVLQTKGVLTIVLILGLTGWTGPYRLIRAEYIKHKAREYVMAADAIGASGWRKMFVHIFPNVSHVALVQMSILVVGFIKAEVILSFLGFGVPVGVVSWGSMLNEAQNELILGKWWQLTAAATAMALLVTAFSLFADSLRDALDPKLK